MRGVRLLSVAGAALAVVGSPGEASARKTGQKDYFLDPPAAGLWAHLDAITIGTQASLEHRLEVDGDITMLVTRLSGLASLGYAETAAHADFRVALFTVGGSVGYRRAWRNFALPNDVDNTAKIRREMDKGESPFERNAINWPWAEGRLRAVIPLESLWLVTNGALRHEGGPGNAFDWFHTNVHDGGLLWRADATLFVRHEDYGAIGPAIRYMRYPKKGQQVDEIAYGFTLGTRPGWRRKMDLFLFQFLTVPTSDEFGFHVLRVPFYTMLIYRASFGLSLPPSPYLRGCFRVTRASAFAA
jgi:hypothetical protein